MEVNMKEELLEELADHILKSNKIKNKNVKLHPGGKNRNVVVRRLREMVTSSCVEIDTVLEGMVEEGHQSLCEYCTTAKFIAVDRRALVQHLLIHHNFEWPKEQPVKSMIVKMLSYVFGYEHPNEVFRWKGGSATWSKKAFQCTLCQPGHKAKPKQFVGSIKFYNHWLERHPGILMVCKMCSCSFGYGGSYLAHRCIGTDTALIPQSVTIDDNSKDVDLLYYDCEYCPPGQKRTFPSFFNFFMHLRQEHNGCEGCLKECTSQEKLKSHVGEKTTCWPMPPTCWKCTSTPFLESMPLHQVPKAFPTLEDLSMHTLMVKPHNYDELKIKCHLCSNSKVWCIYHFCNQFNDNSSEIGSHYWDGITNHPMSQAIEAVEPTELENYAMDAIAKNQRIKNNPLMGLNKNDIFYCLQIYGQPQPKSWCLRWWWRSSSFQHLLMLTKHVLDLQELKVDLNQDLLVSSDDEQENMDVNVSSQTPQKNTSSTMTMYQQDMHGSDISIACVTSSLPGLCSGSVTT